MATLERLMVHTIPLYLDPVPAAKTLRKWFADWGVKQSKANKQAARGGGPVYYAVADVERGLQKMAS